MWPITLAAFTRSWTCIREGVVSDIIDPITPPLPKVFCLLPKTVFTDFRNWSPLHFRELTSENHIYPFPKLVNSALPRAYFRKKYLPISKIG